MDQRQGNVFLFGTGRSGTTILLRMLACHPEFAWLSNLNERFPSHPGLSVLSRLRDSDLTAGVFSGWRRYLPMPAEAIEAPRQLTGGLFQSHRPLAHSDIDPAIVSRYRNYVRRVMKWQGKGRFLHKHTGFARIAFLDQMDPLGRFVQIVRDGRAVAYSMLRAPWWDGTLKSWWWGDIPDGYRDEYEDSGRDPLILAGIVWKHLLDLTAVEIENIPAERILTIRYTDFLKDPMATIDEVCRHTGLDMSERFERRLKRFRIWNADEAWRAKLTDSQITSLESSLLSHLQRYGF
jgi:hypothetical protein